MKFPKTIPKIRVEKYLLRKWNEGDIPYSYTYLTDPETIKDTSFDIKKMSDMKKRIAGHQQQFKERQRLGWIIEDTETGKTIGEISCFDIDVDNEKGEIGYFLGKEYWGQGIMSSILRVIIKYLFDDLGIRRLESIVIKENIGSCRLLEKNGFEQEGILKHHKYCRDRYRDFIMYAKNASS